LIAGKSKTELLNAFCQCFKEGDERLMAHLSKLGHEVLSNAGSTATVVVVQHDHVTVANVGDSQAYLLRKGQAVSLSTPHRVYGSGTMIYS
jgi:serine/threonine protein phosphatase PrpC